MCFNRQDKKQPSPLIICKKRDICNPLHPRKPVIKLNLHSKNIPETTFETIKSK
ncbi:hypothetical protein CHISP_2900 [Chitinispirillum alkaliphilum]|nr:hypothetical protein CHISP_2900 [Chitinispirillum alkaliphilum]